MKSITVDDELVAVVRNDGSVDTHLEPQKLSDEQIELVRDQVRGEMPDELDEFLTLAEGLESKEPTLREIVRDETGKKASEIDSPYWLYVAWCLMYEKKFGEEPERDFNDLTGKETGQWKHLMNMYGSEFAIDMIECLILDWEALKDAMDLGPRPNVGILLGFKSQIEAAVQSNEGFTTRTHRVSEFGKKRNE